MTDAPFWCKACKTLYEDQCTCEGSNSELSAGLSAAATFDDCVEILRSLVDAVKAQAVSGGQESIRVRVQRIKAEAYLKALGI